MKNKRNTILGIAALVLGLGAWLTSMDRNRPVSYNGARTGEDLFPKLRLEQIAGIRVATTNQTSEIRKESGNWKVASLFGYPANEDIVAQQLIALTSLRIGQVMPGSEKNPEDFGFDAHARTVDILGADRKSMATLAIGKERLPAKGENNPFGPMPEGQFVRVGDGPVILVSSDLGGLSADSVRWINPSLFSLPSSDITRIAVSSTNETSIIRLLGNGKYEMEGLADDEEIATGRVGRLERALQYIQVLGVADPKQPAEQTGLNKAMLYVAETKEGLRYSVSIGNSTEKGRYATFAFEVDLPEEPTDADADKALLAAHPSAGTNETQVVKNSEADIAAKLAELKKAHAEKIATLNKKLADLKKIEGWTYILPTYTADDMTPPRAELVQEKAPAPETPDKKAEAPENEANRSPNGATPVTVYSDPIAVTNMAVRSTGEKESESPIPAGEAHPAE